MKKAWENPRVLGLELHHTNDGQGVYYSSKARTTLICRGVGSIGADGKVTIDKHCGEHIFGATLDEARANWYKHCAEVHPNDPPIGDELVVGRIS